MQDMVWKKLSSNVFPHEDVVIVQYSSRQLEYSTDIFHTLKQIFASARSYFGWDRASDSL